MNDIRVRVPAHVFARDFDGELVIVDLECGDYFGLDEIGARAWQGLSAGQSLGQIADALVEEYDAERDRVLADLESLVRDLVARKLVVVEGR